MLPILLHDITFAKSDDEDVTSQPGADHFPSPLHHRSTILSALGLDHAITITFAKSDDEDVTSQLGADHFPSPLHHCSTILSALGLDHAITVLFLGTHEQLLSGSPILGVLWPPSRLTSEFLRNPKPVSSQNASC
ncbi:hypothetical protein DVH24_013173 [Malus domestica]|uniref:Uncharacterized protein n=1 Tax=Malus domestica TaxID=3750 RepID=A0A498IK40_MALDO|nr:hypothetical protein DVH24_013173 [Malus domestica]